MTKTKPLTPTQQELVTKNCALITYIVGRYFKTLPDQLKDELIAEGHWTLVKAATGFDATLGYKFSTYACNALYRNSVQYIQRHSEQRIGKRGVRTGSFFFDGVGTLKATEERERTEELEVVGKRALKICRAVKDDRALAILHGAFWGGLTNKEMGKALGITSTRVDQIKRRVLRQIREREGVA